MSIATVLMFELTAKQEGTLVAVKFRRFHGDSPAMLRCRPQDVLSRRPLQVLLTIPPGASISDMRQFEGQEILAQPAGYPSELNNQE